MKVTSVRYGFATNSSSSHSVIHGGPEWASMTNEEIADKYNPMEGNLEFGWEFDEYDDFNSIVTYAILAHVNLNFYTDYYQKLDRTQFEFNVLSLGFSETLTRMILDNAKIFMDDAYVDHQSFIGGTEEDVWTFIRSVIEVHTGNDNV